MVASYAALLVVIALSDVASPQLVARDPAEPAAPANTWVRDYAGVETHGRLVRLNKKAKEVILLVDGQERKFPLADVRLVQKHRRRSLLVVAGTGLMAAIGFGVGFLAGVHCELQGTCHTGYERRWTITAIFAGGGAVFGSLVPQRKTIYAGPKRATPPASKQAGVTLLRLRW